MSVRAAPMPEVPPALVTAAAMAAAGMPLPLLLVPTIVSLARRGWRAVPSARR